MSLNNPNDQKRYVFPARAVQALQADADGNVGKTFSLHWRRFIEAAERKAPLDEETIYALDLFCQIQFRFSAEDWRRFEGLLARAENHSGQSGAFVFSDGTPAHEVDADLYFDALYASKNTSSQTPPHTLRMIAKYLFAVRNLPVDRAFRFATKTNDGVIPPQPHHELHLKALDKIWVHWNAWRDAEMAAEQQRAAEKAAEQQPHVEPYAFPETCTYSNMLDGSPKTFLLNWFDFFDVAKEKVGFPQKLDFVLSGFAEVEFTFSREEWVQLKDLRERAKQFSNRPQTLLPDGSFACESLAHGYFEHLYARGDNNSSINPNTLRLIAKYLFAVRNLSSDRALPFVESMASFRKAMLKFEENKDAVSASLHNQVYRAIMKHWQAWRDAEKASDQVEYAQVPESPIQPSEPLETPQSMGYLFPPRAVIVKGDEASNPPRKRFRLFWGQFIRHAAKKAPIDPKTAYALDLFNQIEFNVSQENFHRLENMLSTAVSLSENPLFTNPDAIIWACESHAINYFDELYSPENHSSQVHPATLRMIAQYLFAVLNVPKGRAQAFSERHIGLGEKSHHALHEKASAAISDHWWAWHTGKGEESEQAEYAQAPEAPIHPAEPLETPDMDALMRRAFAAFEEGKPLAEAGMVVCDAFGLREVYEEQLKDPKNRVILALGETLLRTLQSVLRPSAPLEKPFVISAPPEDTARPRTPADPPAATLMSDVVKDMIEGQQHAERMAEINAAYRQRDEQIRQAKAIADAECQDALERISRGYAKGEEGVWLPLVGHAQQAYAPPDAWEGFRKQALSGEKPIAQIIADLKAKADEQHELSEKIRERFAGKGEDFVEQLRKRVVRRKNIGHLNLGVKGN